MHGLQMQRSKRLRRGARRDRTLSGGDEPAEIELTYSITSAPTDRKDARRAGSVHNLGIMAASATAAMQIKPLPPGITVHETQTFLGVEITNSTGKTIEAIAVRWS